MNAGTLYTLLNDLPDDYVTAAAGTHRQSRSPLYILVPALAACITLLLAAAVYPKLQTQRPERQDPVYTAETTELPVTTALPEEQEPPASTAAQTVQTTASAVTTRTQTAMTTAVTAKTQSAAQSGTTQPVRQEHTSDTEREIPAETHETVATSNPYTKVPAEAVGQTVPFSLRKGRRDIPGNPQETVKTGNPQEMQDGSTGTTAVQTYAPETTEQPTAQTTEQPTVKTTEQPSVRTKEAVTTALPEPTTTNVVTIAPPDEQQEPETTSSSPYFVDADDPVQAKAERNASRWQITLTPNCLDAALMRGELADGTLVLDLICLRGTPDGKAVVLLLTLPAEIHEQLADISVRITETEDAAEFERIAGQMPLIYDRTKKEDVP